VSSPETPLPDIVLQIDLFGFSCPEQSDLDSIADIVKGELPLGKDARTKAICFSRPDFDNSNLLTIGLWANSQESSDELLENALIATGALVPGQGNVALLVTTDGLQNVASAMWESPAAAKAKKIDLDIGVIRLSDEIKVTIENNTSEAGGNDFIVTTINGEYKVEFLPNVSFTYTAKDLLSLVIPEDGAPPWIDAKGNPSVSAPTTVDIIGTLLSAINATLGDLVFWGGESLLDEIAPMPNTAIGGVIAAQWPTEVLTKIVQPSLPGKIVFTWSTFVVDGRGILAEGIVQLTSRSPQVSIEGPESVTVKLPIHGARQTYSLFTSDLRGKLVIRWRIDGVRAGVTSTQMVDFESPSASDPFKVYRQLQVTVYDEDRLTATEKRRLELDVVVQKGKQQQ
jgi:hypothetical protein